MIAREMPAISDAAHSHTIYGLGNLGQALATTTGTTTGGALFDFVGDAKGVGAFQPFFQQQQNFIQDQAVRQAAPAPAKPKQPKPKEPELSRRIVQVFIADPDENVPLDQAILYSGEQKLTDLTDQELFFEVDIKSILEAHNAKRTSLVNKKIKERTENLEPARVRDLRMVVVTVASF